MTIGLAVRTQREVAEKLGLDLWEVRKIERSAMRKLRKSGEMRNLHRLAIAARQVPSGTDPGRFVIFARRGA